MDVYRRLVLVCGFLLLVPSTVLAQLPPVCTQPVNNSGLRKNKLPAPETGAPYFVMEETRFSQTLLDGTHVDRRVSARQMYRDSQGRIRVESYLAMLRDGSDDPELSYVVIIDPVIGTQYFLDVQNHKAVVSHREVQAWSKVNQTVDVRVATAATATADIDKYHPQVTDESLGTDTMEGLTVVGCRQTETYPVGAQGNDRPFSVVSEAWTSPELGLDVLSSRDDPRYGVTTARLTKVDRTEPDPSLFQVPADYTIEERASNK